MIIPLVHLVPVLAIGLVGAETSLAVVHQETSK